MNLYISIVSFLVFCFKKIYLQYVYERANLVINIFYYQFFFRKAIPFIFWTKFLEFDMNI